MNIHAECGAPWAEHDNRVLGAGLPFGCLPADPTEGALTTRSGRSYWYTTERLDNGMTEVRVLILTGIVAVARSVSGLHDAVGRAIVEVEQVEQVAAAIGMPLPEVQS